MKKLFIAAIAIAACVSAKAQETYAPEAGEFSTEIQFNPFTNDFGTFKLDQLKFRYMFTDEDALRFGIGFGVDNHKNVADPDNTPDAWSKSHTANFSINLGYERHFFNYKRLDLYAGAAIGYEYNNAGSKRQELRNFSGSEGYYEFKTVNKSGNSRTGNYFTAAIFTGLDFYVYKGLFVGAEFGIKLKAGSQPGWYEEYPAVENNILITKKDAPQDKSTSFSLACKAEPALRIGWTF